MKIVKLTAENIKKLVAVEITPTGELVEITGRNGAGKSSVLDAIWWAVAGTKSIQAVPIRSGADKARIRLDLGELIVERRFTPKGSTLSVEKADGARYPSPQSILDALLGALAFDPLAFVGQAPADQLDTLRRLVPLDVDPDQLDRLNAGDFAKRTDLSRDARARRAQADGIVVRKDLPAEALDVAAVKDALAAAATSNAELVARQSRREEAGRGVEAQRVTADERRVRAQNLRQQAQVLDEDAAEIERRADEMADKLAKAPPLPTPVDATALRAELDMAEATNAGLAARTRRAALVIEAEQLEGNAKTLTTTMEAREAEKAAAIAKAPMPVPGLGFGDGLVTFEGRPFAQASTAEQLRVSVAIAMAANPKLRVLRIKEGSLLDADNLALIAGMAKEHDYQIWIERVDTSGKVGVVIEDGTVKAVNA
jgi:DNA repair exonuclease SbcCD ATPase subunit